MRTIGMTLDRSTTAILAFVTAIAVVGSVASGIQPAHADDAVPHFPDIAGNVHEAAIQAIVVEGVTQGRDDGTFGPDEAVTRGQMASFLERAFDLPAGDNEVAFDDVAGTTHEAGILAVAEADIAAGFGDGSFRPDEAVTRGQMAAFLARALDLEDDDAPFLDTIGTTHEGPIGAVAQAGIAGGFGDGNFGPAQAVTRGQMATFIARALELIDRVDPPDPLPQPSLANCDDAADSQEHTARCLYAAVDAGDTALAETVAATEVVDELLSVSASDSYQTWRFEGCGQAILLVLPSDTSCTFYEPSTELPHGVVIEFGMGTRDGSPFVEQIGYVG